MPAVECYQHFLNAGLYFSPSLAAPQILKMMWLVFNERALPISCRWKGTGDAAHLHCCSHFQSVTVTLAKNCWNKRNQETYTRSH